MAPVVSKHHQNAAHWSYNMFHGMHYQDSIEPYPNSDMNPAASFQPSALIVIVATVGSLSAIFGVIAYFYFTSYSKITGDHSRVGDDDYDYGMSDDDSDEDDSDVEEMNPSFNKSVPYYQMNPLSNVYDVQTAVNDDTGPLSHSYSSYGGMGPDGLPGVTKGHLDYLNLECRSNTLSRSRVQKKDMITYLYDVPEYCEDIAAYDEDGKLKIMPASGDNSGGNTGANPEVFL